MVAGTHCQGEDLASFSPRRFYSTTFALIGSENAVHIGGFYFMRLLRLALCSPLIFCRIQGKRNDYCKVRIEVLNLFLGEK